MERKDIERITDGYLDNQDRQEPDLETTLTVNRSELEILQSAVACYMAQITIARTMGFNTGPRTPGLDDIRSVRNSLASPVSSVRRDETTQTDELSGAFEEFKEKIENHRQQNQTEA
jgi:hypothetical protein